MTARSFAHRQSCESYLFSLMFIMQRVESGVSGQLNRLCSEEFLFFSPSIMRADKEAILLVKRLE